LGSCSVGYTTYALAGSLLPRESEMAELALNIELEKLGQGQAQGQGRAAGELAEGEGAEELIDLS